jgi:hypothetical protein
MILATAATETGLSWVDLSVIALVVSSAAGVAFPAAKFFMDFLIAKVGNTEKARERRAEEIRQVQSEACKFDHSTIQSILTQQNANIVKLLEQNAVQISAYMNANHAAELRHQIVLTELKRLWDHMPKRQRDLVSE